MLTVKDIMTLSPVYVSSDTTLNEIIGIMKTHGYRQLPVVDNGKLVGIVTDRDVRLVMNSPIVLHDHQEDIKLLNTVTAESCMTPNPITVTPDTPAYRAAEMLSIYKFGALPVLENDELVGIVTVTDYLDYFTSQEPKNIVDPS
ncbi:MAG: CBS domain-containing protein [Candidatus Thermofonsia bacterium]|jgi:acetoin utilization protein AcuB|nr:MAG: CBS domain-containing protein [Candidatus Thermofonsia bacterium]